MPVEREAYSIPEAASAIGVSRALLYKLLRDGAGPTTFTIGRRRLVSAAALRAWMARREGRRSDGERAD